MSGFWFDTRKSLRWLPIVLLTGRVNAQTCMVLSPPTIAANGTASLDLSLYSERGGEPAAVQWTLQYPLSNIKNLKVDDGPALTSAGKTAMCTGDAAAYTCMMVGANTKTIANGIVAKLTAVLIPGATTATILIKSARGVSTAGYPIPVMTKLISNPGADVSSECKPQLQKRAPAGK